MEKMLFTINNSLIFAIIISMLFMVLQNLPYVSATPSYFNNIDDLNNAITTHHFVLVEYWQPGCEFCHQMFEPVQQLSNDYGNSVFFAKFNTHNDASTENMSTPTFVLYENGLPIGDPVKGAYQDQLKDLLRQHVQTQTD